MEFKAGNKSNPGAFISQRARNGGLMETRDGDDGNTQTLEPEVHKAVLAEVKKLGDNTKEISERLNQTVTELRKQIKDGETQLDAGTQEKVAKMAEDVLTKQEALESKATERMDSLELLVKKISRGGVSLTGDDAEEQFKQARDYRTQLLAAQKTLKPEGVLDADVNVEDYGQFIRAFKRHLRVNEKWITPDEQKYLSVGIDPDGGIVVPPYMSSQIVEKIFETDPIRQLANIQPIGSDMFEQLVDIGEAETTWENELVATDETDTPQFKKRTIPVFIQSARPRATQKLLEDAAINMEAWIANKVAARFARAEGAAFVTGTGINQPRGFLTYSAGSAWAQIEQVGSGDSIVTADGLITLYYYLLEEYAARCAWIMNRMTVLEVMLLKDKNDQYLWRPGLQEGQPSVLLGRPIRMATTMPVSAANALPIALADWQEAYTIVDRLGISVQRDPYTVKPFVEFYTRRRVGGDVMNFQAIKLQKNA